MRLVELVINTDGDEEYQQALEHFERNHCVRAVDWKVFAEEVLEKVDQQLERFGLEVLLHHHGGDYYEWHIDKRRPGSNAPPKESPEAVEFWQRFVGATGGQEAVDSRAGRGKEHLDEWREGRRAYFAALKAKSDGGNNEDE